MINSIQIQVYSDKLKGGSAMPADNEVNLKLCDGEYRLADIVWENEPVGSGELVRLCGERLGWKKSTTYTVLRKLCEKKILKNEDSVVSSLAGRQEVAVYEGGAVMDRAFGGSLPKFIAAFLSDRGISEGEAEEIQALIDRFREKGGHDA